MMKAALALVGGISCYALAYLFFRYLPGYLARWYGFVPHAPAEFAITVLGLGAVTASGYRGWKTRGGLQSYHESALYHDFGDDNGGAFLVDHYLHRITGPAHMVSQIFLAGFGWLGGFTPPSAPHHGGETRSWFHCMMMFVCGAVGATVVDHHVGLIDRTNLRVLYIIIGTLLMIASCLWLLGIRQTVARPNEETSARIERIRHA